MPPLAMVSVDNTKRSTALNPHLCRLDSDFSIEQEPAAGQERSSGITQKSGTAMYFEALANVAPSPNASSTSSDTSADEDVSYTSLQPLQELLDNSHHDLPVANCEHPIFMVDNRNKPEHHEEASTHHQASFLALRSAYLIVTFVIMLADGLQGTHLYVLYESYGFSVASLYCLGFATGGLLSPVTGPLVDRIGRKKAAILYCALEMFINMLEQYPFLTGLIASRMIGGLTTNLLNSVFESWLDTEYRKRGFAKPKYEIIMRDSVIVSNLAAIFSGYLAHVLAEHYGPIGPFRGAVSCTAIALVVVCFVWTENYGSSLTTNCDGASRTNMIGYFQEAAMAFRNDSKMLRIGLLQGLTEGSIQIFVFLWSPTLRHYAVKAPLGSFGLNKEGEPAYGLIFGAYMFVGVLGGILAPHLRTIVGKVLRLNDLFNSEMSAVECVTAVCYLVSAIMLFVPSLCSDESSWSFSISMAALLAFELLIGVFLPLEGVIRSHYFPVDARASIMGLPRIVVNAAVAIGVVSTEFVSMKTAFGAIGMLMVIASILQLTLIPVWGLPRARASKIRRSITALAVDVCPALRRLSSISENSFDGGGQRPRLKNE